ncbi:hypothetical protein L7F22_041402 [Adiantum nelumboides]|nr:hypothetical protein [Adiantum nelumboides]
MVSLCSLDRPSIGFEFPGLGGGQEGFESLDLALVSWLYQPHPDRKIKRVTKARLQTSNHSNRENENPLLSGFLRDGAEAGKKVTVEQCKEYLRKHGLRLSGTKAVLIERIRGHLLEQEKAVNNQFQDLSSDPNNVDITEQFDNLDLNQVNVAATVALLKDERKLTIEDSKAYLRKHGLRLAGSKQVLIDRIKEHVQVKDDQGLTKYPEATFTINCQGDACMGDIVLFKQRVYDS